MKFFTQHFSLCLTKTGKISRIISDFFCFIKIEVKIVQPIIEFCISNLANGSHKALAKLEKDPNLDVVEYSCLSYCTKCAQSLFALVNGEVVIGETPDELVENIYKFIEENVMF
jgi:uncharacterized protein YuzB (UPF0349 family)